MTATAQNQFAEPSGSGAAGGAGGVANGSAVSSDATLTGTSSVNLGNKRQHHVGDRPQHQPRRHRARRFEHPQYRRHRSRSVPAVPSKGAATNSTLHATLTNSVTTGTGDHLTTSGNIGLGTYTTVDAQTNSEVNTYGLASVGIAYATTGVSTNQTVTVGANTIMSAFGNVNLTPGNEPTGALQHAS